MTTNNWNDPNNAHPPIDMTLPKPSQDEYNTARNNFKQAIQKVLAFNFDDYRNAHLGKISQENLDKRYNQAVKELEEAQSKFRELKIRGGF